MLHELRLPFLFSRIHKLNLLKFLWKKKETFAQNEVNYQTRKHSLKGAA